MAASFGSKLFKFLAIMGAGALLLALLFNFAALPSESKAFPIQGTFLQLTADHGEWTREKWNALFGYFKQLGLSQLVIQWTVYDDLAFYPAGGFRQVSNPPLPLILDLADKSGMKVMVGLAHDPAYWEKIKSQPMVLEVYLQRLRLRSLAAARELAPMAASRPSFQGWYLPEEIDDVTWPEAGARALLFTHLKETASQLKLLTPGARIALSGFSNARLDPQALGRFWGALLEAAPLDLVFFQDGIGTGKLGLDFLPLYLDSVRRSVAGRGRKMQAVVELFHQVSEHPFRARPAPWPRVLQQLKLAGQYSPAGLIAFSVPECLTPLGGPEARQLFDTYRAHFGLR
jgi:hypothetical protein